MLVEHTTNDAYWGDGGDGRARTGLDRSSCECEANWGERAEN